MGKLHDQEIMWRTEGLAQGVRPTILIIIAEHVVKNMVKI